jgi:hypothetical protein
VEYVGVCQNLPEYVIPMDSKGRSNRFQQLFQQILPFQQIPGEGRGEGREWEDGRGDRREREEGRGEAGGVVWCGVMEGGTVVGTHLVSSNQC